MDAGNFAEPMARANTTRDAQAASLFDSAPESFSPEERERFNTFSKTGVASGTAGEGLSNPAAPQGETLAYIPPNRREPLVPTPAATRADVPEAIRAPIEDRFAQDFSNVRVRRDSTFARDIGAEAFTRGDELHFAPGRFQPHSGEGRQLIRHELTHVAQQRAGLVEGGVPVGDGMRLNLDADLESEAESADHNPAGSFAKPAAGAAAPGGDVIQAYFDAPHWIEIEMVREYAEQAAAPGVLAEFLRIANDASHPVDLRAWLARRLNLHMNDVYEWEDSQQENPPVDLDYGLSPAPTPSSARNLASEESPEPLPSTPATSFAGPGAAAPAAHSGSATTTTTTSTTSTTSTSAEPAAAADPGPQTSDGQWLAGRMYRDPASSRIYIDAGQSSHWIYNEAEVAGLSEGELVQFYAFASNPTVAYSVHPTPSAGTLASSAAPMESDSDDESSSATHATVPPPGITAEAGAAWIQRNAFQRLSRQTFIQMIQADTAGDAPAARRTLDNWNAAHQQEAISLEAVGWTREDYDRAGVRAKQEASAALAEAEKRQSRADAMAAAAAERARRAAELSFAPPRASPNQPGYNMIVVRLRSDNRVVGRARYSRLPRPIPNSNAEPGIELSGIDIEQEFRGRRYGSLLLEHFFDTVGQNTRMWLQADSQGGLDSTQLQNWYRRNGFAQSNNGNIMIREQLF